jgi:hypothetical protein
MELMRPPVSEFISQQEPLVWTPPIGQRSWSLIIAVSLTPLIAVTAHSLQNGEGILPRDIEMAENDFGERRAVNKELCCAINQIDSKGRNSKNA